MVRYGEYDFERMIKEEAKTGDVRSEFEIDRDRIIHSSAFRRLQAKTQVYGAGLMDFYRTRLTHSIEVAQISKAIGLKLGIDTDLLEAIALAHDIGHPPFGHTGEKVLNELLDSYGGFEANAHNIIVLMFLETKIGDKGLNLTRATLDGLLKYKNKRSENRSKFLYDDEFFLGFVNWIDSSWENKRRSVECQIVKWADDVAYSVHDLEDGIKGGLLKASYLSDNLLSIVYEKVSNKVSIFSQGEVDKIFYSIKESIKDIENASSGIEKKRKIRKLTSDLIHTFVVNVSLSKLDEKESRYSYSLVVPDEVLLKNLVLRAIENELIYENKNILKTRKKCEMIVRKLFEVFSDKSSKKLYPIEYQEYWDMFDCSNIDANRYRLASWYIAGMTDNFAIKTYNEFFDPNTLVDIFTVI